MNNEQPQEPKCEHSRAAWSVIHEGRLRCLDCRELIDEPDQPQSPATKDKGVKTFTVAIADPLRGGNYDMVECLRLADHEAAMKAKQIELNGCEAELTTIKESYDRFWKASHKRIFALESALKAKDEILDSWVKSTNKRDERIQSLESQLKAKEEEIAGLKSEVSQYQYVMSNEENYLKDQLKDKEEALATYQKCLGEMKYYHNEACIKLKDKDARIAELELELKTKGTHE